MSWSIGIGWMYELDDFLSDNQTLFLSVLLPLIVWLVTRMSLVSQERRAADERRAERELQRQLKVSEFRQQWINELRNEFAEFIVLTGKLFEGGKNDLFECYALLSKLRMRMNPSDPNFVALMKILEEASSTDDVKKLAEAHGALALLGQKILKAEWERLKSDLAREEKKS